MCAAQTATLYQVEGGLAAGIGEGGQAILSDAPVSTGYDALVTDACDYRLFAGWRSDPFFPWHRGALDNLRFTGAEFFADADVCSIVMEIPNSAPGPGTVGLWHRTFDGTCGVWVQADRGALPSQAVFLPGDHRADYFGGEPVNDVSFVPVFAHSLEHTGGYTPEEAARVAKTLLPDVLQFDPRLPASYPTNGRALTDDVIDVFLPLLTNGKIIRDDVGPHADLIVEFPYLGPPHKVRSAGVIPRRG